MEKQDLIVLTLPTVNVNESSLCRYWSLLYLRNYMTPYKCVAVDRLTKLIVLTAQLTAGFPRHSKRP